MARLIDLPTGVGFTARQLAAGARSGGQAQTESVTGAVQTSAIANSLWIWQLSLPLMFGRRLVEWESFCLAMHGGANAVRLNWGSHNPDEMMPSEMGVTRNPDRWQVPQSVGGLPMLDGPPLERVAAAALIGDTIIRLDDQTWGRVVWPTVIGFVGHFGWYRITQKLGGGRYRIWPPLRRAVTTADRATLRPVMAATLAEPALPSRGLESSESMTITVVEVEDYRVATDYAD